MTRNNKSELTYSPSRSTTNTSFTDDNFINLPDLSSLKDNEKQHILNVLGRDEILRSKHLSRFMQLRKEVNELEQQSQPTSTSVCARCQAPFGFIFNTGATCPKCGAKVCKQCRLMYNVNDNGWLCQLCCKQMQLLSYSGEWIYTFRSNLRKDSLTASELIRNSLSPTISIPNLNQISSSDTETEDVTSPSNIIYSSLQQNKLNQKNSNNNINRMIVQTITDEEKLSSIKKNVRKRPFSISPTQPISPNIRQFSPSNLLTGGSSDDVDSLFDQSTNYTDRTSSSSIRMNTNDKYRERSSSTPKSIHSLTTMQNERNQITNNDIDRRPVDCASVTSSEWGAESERGEPNLPPQDTSIKNNSKHSLRSRMNLSGSIQSIRDVVHRIPKSKLSTSRTSINSEQKPKSETLDTTSSKIPNEQSNSGMYPTWSSG
ncbi:unnamed protein product [Rotaria sp. Silwood2]|nr:unnamed protein product [Rotaria sp. Silwood2]CAF2512006.1 unnamed protein product [Rotaria sp. Silwood2]CAF2888980.1 unnamed protein product [Rotaria sp. Silwood2]CAF3866921.1 unnamed protein product [Rotaria sp. Silwood2]CAF3902139.1 unnamed protein product [Rotaria sp. Silwood2]